MVKPQLRTAYAVLVFIFVISVPQIALSQKQDQSAANQFDTKTAAEETDAMSLDDLKKMRITVKAG